MKLTEKSWLFGLLAIALTYITFIFFFTTSAEPVRDTPRNYLPERKAHRDHKLDMPGPYVTPQEVTSACLVCHQDAGAQVMHTSHWQWQTLPEAVPGREDDEPVAIGKRNTFNNLCIGFSGDWSTCTACHTGYGWQDNEFDFTNVSNVDCLACHERTGTYIKTARGLPEANVDLTLAAQSVGMPVVENCSSCHYRGRGVIEIKHGNSDGRFSIPQDIPESLTEYNDVHLDRHNMVCVDCHGITDKQSNIRSMTTGRRLKSGLNNGPYVDSLAISKQTSCTSCHTEQLHRDERINMHTRSVSCQACHIPDIDVAQTDWQWSPSITDETDEETDAETDDEASEETAVDNEADEAIAEEKISGAFTVSKNKIPQYRWYNGSTTRYLLGDEITEPKKTTVIEKPNGSILDPEAKIWPFTVHKAQHPIDSLSGTLLVPLFTEATESDWNSALLAGAEAYDVEYNEVFEFTNTTMYWPVTHRVSPKTLALACRDCHGESNRFNWGELGYSGDPVNSGTAKRDAVLKQFNNALLPDAQSTDNSIADSEGDVQEENER